MSYESAPATAMLATHCAACDRPLLDARSVEAGIGPECRKRHGYAAPEGAADWQRVRELPTAWRLVGDLKGDAHAAANRIVHRAACTPHAERAELVEACHALGFVRLASRLAAAAGDLVTVRRDGDAYAVVAPYADGMFGDRLKAARVGARWSGSAKAWVVPTDARAKRALWDAICATFGGGMVASERGLTRIAAAQEAAQ